MVSFAAPALLFGVAAAALPLAIHLLLRARPRRVRFPPVGFLRAALAAGQRAQRLRNLRLLLLRALALACAALLLAGPTCAPRVSSASDPVACVLVIDDSWSMQYQLDDQTTLLHRAGAEARAWLRSAADWSQPASFGLVWSDPARPVTELSGDLAAVQAAVRQAAPAPPHAATLQHALRRAVRLLSGAREPRRHLLVFTDGAAHAWRDVAPGLLTGIENLAVTVCRVAPEQVSNIAVAACRVPTALHPETAPVPLEVTLTAAGLEATCALVVRDAAHVVQRVGPLAVPAGGERSVTLLLPPQPAGAHALTLEVEPQDRLPFDQRRYAVFQTGQRPVVWLATGAAAGPDQDLTALLMQNLLAPETLAPSQQAVTLLHMQPADLSARPAVENAARQAGREVDLVVVTGGIELNEAARQRLRRAAESGAVVLLVPGSGPQGGEWAGLRRLLARSILRVETLDATTSMAWEPGSRFAQRSVELDELTRAAVRRRVVPGGLEEGVAVEARYTDGVPAILSLRVGRGQIVLLTTSPDPGWSELGQRAAGLLTWLHTLLREAVGTADAVAAFTAGQLTRHAFVGLPEQVTVQVTPQDAQAGGPWPVSVVDGQPPDGWPTRQPGIYTIQGGSRPLRYVVNWPAEESDLTPIAEDRLRALLGVAEVRLTGTQVGAEQQQGPTLLARLTGLADAATVLPVVLLGLLLGELWLASRGAGPAGAA